GALPSPGRPALQPTNRRSQGRQPAAPSDGSATGLGCHPCFPARPAGRREPGQARGYSLRCLRPMHAPNNWGADGIPLPLPGGHARAKTPCVQIHCGFRIGGVVRFDWCPPSPPKSWVAGVYCIHHHSICPALLRSQPTNL
ncbi:unnamed protein product, partial [Amoebophrya sp. A120]